MGFGLIIAFIRLLHIVGISNYNLSTNSHILQFATAYIKSSVSLSSLVV
jgi:hypothetical protein